MKMNLCFQWGGGIENVIQSGHFVRKNQSLEISLLHALASCVLSCGTP